MKGTEVIKFENLPKYKVTNYNEDEKHWLVNKMSKTSHGLEMIFCKIKIGKIPYTEKNEKGNLIYGDNCIIVMMTDEACRAYVLNLKDMMTFGYLKSYVWNGVKNNSYKKLTFKIENVDERVFYFKNEDKIRAVEQIFDNSGGFFMNSDFCEYLLKQDRILFKFYLGDDNQN